MKGIKLLKEVIEEEPNNENALYYLGNFSIQSGQYEKAILRFENLVKVSPDNYEARYLLGYSFEMMKDSSNAIKNYDFVAKSAGNKEIKKLAEEGIDKLLKH
jgi:cytochrome c-type biogenesis protein CcmH/NrfG